MLFVGEDRGWRLGGRGRGAFDEKWAGGGGQMGGGRGQKNLNFGRGTPLKNGKKKGGGGGREEKFERG